MKAGGPNKRISVFFQVGLLAAVALLLLAILVSSFIPPSIVVGQDRITFGAEEGVVATRPQNIPIIIQNKFFGAHRDLLWKAKPQADWLIVRPKTGKGAGSIEIRPITRRLPTGTYWTKIAVTCSGARNSPREILVVVNSIARGASAPPFGWVDTPQNGQRVRGDFLDMWGWALDDIEVKDVRIKRNPFPNEGAGPLDADGLIPVGRASFFRGIRPDVEKANPECPLNDQAAWWFRFPLRELFEHKRATLVIHVFLEDKEGHLIELASKAVRLAG